MATVTEALSNVIEQKIEPTIYEAGWKLDPIYPLLKRSSDGVKNTGIGRNWTVIRPWVLGVSGGAKFQSARGSNIVSGPQHFNVYGTPQTFPQLDETVGRAYIQSTTELIEQQGNIFLPQQFFRLEQLQATVGPIIAQELMGFSRLVTQQEMAMFYSTSPTSKALATVGDTSVTFANASGDTSAVEFNIAGTSSVGRVHRFIPGMHVDLYTADGLTKANLGFRLVIDNVDPSRIASGVKAPRIRIRRIDGGEFQTTTVLNGGGTLGGTAFDLGLLVIADSINQGPSVLENWIADGSTGFTSFFGIDVRNFGEYKSYVVGDTGHDASGSAIGSALNNTILNRHYGWFWESFPGKELDCAITTMGVLIGFIDNLDSGQAGISGTVNGGRMRYDVQGETLKVNAGWRGFEYSFGDRSIEIYTSTYCQPGAWYAGKLKNGGLTRYIPPGLPGAKSDSKIGNELEFVMGMGQSGGYRGIFGNVYSSSGAFTNFMQAPCVRNWQFMPEQPNFMKLAGLTEVIGL